MNMIWWEKTVEYFFVQNYVDLQMLICPLDGDHENAGDAIFANAENWILIEFKKEECDIVSEKNKFKNYQKAKEYLSNRDAHHFLIYGAIDNTKNFIIQVNSWF